MVGSLSLHHSHCDVVIGNPVVIGNLVVIVGVVKLGNCVMIRLV